MFDNITNSSLKLPETLGKPKIHSTNKEHINYQKRKAFLKEKLMEFLNSNNKLVNVRDKGGMYKSKAEIDTDLREIIMETPELNNLGVFFDDISHTLMVYRLTLTLTGSENHDPYEFHTYPRS